MADDIDRDAPREAPRDRPVDEPPPRRRKRWGLRILAVLVLLPAVLIGLWIAIALNFSYSQGDRVGYLQKFSRKGWLCKTWEGELAMVSIPGTTPEIFPFTVRDGAVARQLEGLLGERVSVTYEEHRGVPTRCFGETQYYVKAARALAGGLAPPAAPAAPTQPGASATPAPAPTTQTPVPPQTPPR